MTRLRNGGDFKPVGALATLPPRLGATLEWLCQKDALGQDALLICAPAERARARRAAFAFAELVNAEAYYVGVSPDTAGVRPTHKHRNVPARTFAGMPRSRGWPVVAHRPHEDFSIAPEFHYIL